MALSNVLPNTKSFTGSDGKFIALDIRWNESTRAWHARRFYGQLFLERATIIPHRQGYTLMCKTWEYAVDHPEKVNYNKVPKISYSQHLDLTSALEAFARVITLP